MRPSHNLGSRVRRVVPVIVSPDVQQQVAAAVGPGAILVCAATLVGCADGGEAEAGTTIPPPPTDAEMMIFCEKYDTVRERSWDELTAALVEVSPAQIKGPMFRTSQPPGETWAEDKEAVEEFLRRCDT